MATIVTRAGKGSPLTHAELDSNFTNLNTRDLDDLNNVSSTTPTDGQALVYNNATSEWEPGEAGFDGNLNGNDLTDSTGDVTVDDAMIVNSRSGATYGIIMDTTTAATNGLNIKTPDASIGLAITNSTGSSALMTVGTEVRLTNQKFPTADGTAGQFLTTDGALQLSWGDPLADITATSTTLSTPTDTALTLEPNGTGALNLNADTISIDGNYTLTTSDGLAGQVLTTDGTGAATWQTFTTDLDDLTDVQVTAPYSPSDGQALVFNSGAGEWRPGSVASTGDVTFTAATLTAGTDQDITIDPDGTGLLVLGSQLDPNGNNIHDENRNYTIIGNNNAPSGNDYDSFSSGGSRVFGPVVIEEVSNPAVNQRVHSNPVLTKISLNADRNDNNARFRCGYKEAVLQTNAFDVDPSVNFGRGFVGNFYSAKISNAGASASTIGQHTALLVTPQLDGLTSNVTSQDMRVLEAQPFIASGGTVDNLYGFHYSTNNSGTITNEFSFYSNEANAQLFNAGATTLSGLNYPTADGDSGESIITNGSGTLSVGRPTEAKGTFNIKDDDETVNMVVVSDANNNGGVGPAAQIDMICNPSETTGNQLYSIDTALAKKPLTVSSGYLQLNTTGGATDGIKLSTGNTAATVRFEPNSTYVMGIEDDRVEVTRPLVQATYSVSTLPTLGGSDAGATAYCDNGNAGSPCMVFWKGDAWRKTHDPVNAPSAT